MNLCFLCETLDENVDIKLDGLDIALVRNLRNSS